MDNSFKGRILAKYDIRGIQSYVFRTNKLKEIRGVSDLPSEIFIKAIEFINNKYKYKIIFKKEDLYNNQKQLNEFDIYILDLAGGNAYVIYKDKQAFYTVSKILSVYLFKETYSLNLAYTHVDITDNFFKDYTDLNKKMGKSKSSMITPERIGSFPIVMQELNTGFPVVNAKENKEGTKEYFCRESQIKLDILDKKGEVGKVFDEMVEKGEDSHIAIIHIDGNNMGARINEILKNIRSYDEAIDNFGKINIKDNFKNVCDEVENKLKETITKINKHNNPKEIPKEVEIAKYIYAIIKAGDDITFVSNAKYAFKICELFFKEISKKERDMFKEGAEHDKYAVSACAGIAFINSHFPFSDAYKLAENCCSKAKSRAKMYVDESGHIGNWIDFEMCNHISDIDLSNRDTYGNVGGVNLLLRPYYVCCGDDDVFDGGKYEEFSFIKFKNRVKKLKQVERSWAKELKNVYTKGRNYVKTFNEKAKSRGKDIAESDDDYYNKEKTYATFYDATEVMDLYEDEFFYEIQEDLI